jgi:hypothetical protein
MTSRGMGDSTVRMREYVGYIIIFMGTACQLSSHPFFDAMHVTPWHIGVPQMVNGHTSKAERNRRLFAYSTKNFSINIVDPRLSVGRQKWPCHL